jgi:hypothetical protein
LWRTSGSEDSERSRHEQHERGRHRENPTPQKKSKPLTVWLRSTLIHTVGTLEFGRCRQSLAHG